MAAAILTNFLDAVPLAAEAKQCGLLPLRHHRLAWWPPRVNPDWQAGDSSPTSPVHTTTRKILHHSLQTAHTKSTSPLGRPTFCSCRGQAQTHQMFIVLPREYWLRLVGCEVTELANCAGYNDQRNWLNAFSRQNWMVVECRGGLLQDLHRLCQNF